MKTSRDPRHQKRIQAVQELFAWQFHDGNQPSTKEAREVTRNLEVIDQEIVKAAKNWPVDQINQIDLAILRLSIFELIIEQEVPYKVIVDEAVEIAKEFGGESSPSFINGVLGNLIKEKEIEEKK